MAETLSRIIERQVLMIDYAFGYLHTSDPVWREAMRKRGVLLDLLDTITGG